MTAEQLARLEALLAKSALTGSENQELAFLRTLAASGASSQASGGDGGGDDGEDEEEEEEEEAEDASGDDADAGEKSSKPSLLDHGKALASSKASLVRRNSELSAQIGRLTAEKSQLSKTIAANAKTIGDLQTELATVKGELAQAKAANKSLSAKVSEELAGLGVKDKDLPAPNKDEKGSTYNSEAEVAAAIEAAKTWEEKQAILDAWEKSQTA